MKDIDKTRAWLIEEVAQLRQRLTEANRRVAELGIAGPADLVIARDITEGRQIEEALQRAHDELELQVETRTTELAKANEELHRINKELTREIAERKRVEEVLQRRNRELNLLHIASQAVNSTLDLDQILITVLEETRRLLGVTATSIWLIDPETKDLICQQATGPRSETVCGWRLAPWQGIVGWVARYGEGVIVPDVQTDGRHYSGVDRETGLAIRSILSVPLRARGVLTGVLQVVDTTVDRFDTADMVLLEPLAVSAAIAIENARLLKAEQERRHIAEMLQQASVVLTSTVELNEVLPLILQQLQQAIPYDTASVQQVQGNLVQVVACHGFENPENIVGLTFPLIPEFPNYRVIEKKKPFAVDNIVELYPHFQSEAVTYESGHIRSWLGVPLLAKEQIVGMIALDRATVQPFSAEEIGLALAFASQAAVAIENAHLFEAVVEGKRDWEATFDAITDGIYIHDSDLRIIRANWTLAEWLGTTPQDLIGRYCYEFLCGTPSLPDHCPAAEAMANKYPERVEWEVAFLDGFFHVSMYTLCDPAGNVWGAVHVLTDITERKQAEEELSCRNEALTVLNAIAATISRSLNQDQMLHGVLHEVLQWGGRFRAEGAGIIFLRDEQSKGLTLAAHQGVPEDCPCLHRPPQLRQCMCGTVAQCGEVIISDNGQESEGQCVCWPEIPLCRDICLPLRVRETVLGVMNLWLPMSQELTDRDVELLLAVCDQIGVAIENARLHEEAAEIEILRELDRLRAELIANVSHELRTPLGLIKSYCTTLLRADLDIDPKTQLGFLRDIDEEADNLEKIVNNLLNLSRLEAGRLRLDRHPTDVSGLAEAVVEEWKIQSPQHDFTCEFPSELLVAIADRGRIQQVLRNLLENAVKYSPGGGTIAVRGQRKRGTILIEVQDQGIGIPSGDLERVFERFYRVESQVSRRVGGVGLGLAVCRGIVEAHGGHIWVESTEGRGSTFSFTLPADQDRKSG